MASRPELVAMCKELDVEHKGMTIEEMDKEVRGAIDKRFNVSKKVLYGNAGASDTLLRFMNEEYDYIFKNINGELVDFRGKEKNGKSD